MLTTSWTSWIGEVTDIHVLSAAIVMQRTSRAFRAESAEPMGPGILMWGMHGPILAPPSVLGRVRRGKRAPVVGVLLVWVGLVWRFFLGFLVVGAGAAVFLVLGVLVAARHDHIG